jgi:pyruvate dehydrogenase E1 component
MGSGAILTEVIKAAQQLAALGVDCDVISVTSWSELARDGAQSLNTIRSTEAATSNDIGASPRGDESATSSFVARQLARTSGPVIAASDYVRAVPEAIRAYLPPGRSYTTLGTDGFGRSDTRAALRDYFGVDAAHIVRSAQRALG